MPYSSPPPAAQPHFVVDPLPPKQKPTGHPACEMKVFALARPLARPPVPYSIRLSVSRKPRRPRVVLNHSSFWSADVVVAMPAGAVTRVCEALISVKEKSESHPSTQRLNCQFVPY